MAKIKGIQHPFRSPFVRERTRGQKVASGLGTAATLTGGVVLLSAAIQGVDFTVRKGVSGVRRAGGWALSVAQRRLRAPADEQPAEQPAAPRSARRARDEERRAARRTAKRTAKRKR